MTDETAELRVLNWDDLEKAGDSDEQGLTATSRVLSNLLEGAPAEGRQESPSELEKTVNIQQGGPITAVRIKLSTPGRSWHPAKWRVVRSGDTVAIRVELNPKPQLVGGLSLRRLEPPPVPPQWVLRVILEHNDLVDGDEHHPLED
jgi:hypothetical protein